jgi:starch synthase
LNQLYSLKYGTVPVVRATGGLADTITNITDETLAAGTGTGFQFREYGSLALSETLRRACNLYSQPEIWAKVVQAGMRQDWSWAHSARQYIDLYQLTIAQRQRGVARTS